MGGRGSGGGKASRGGSSSNIHDEKTQNLINQLENNLKNINQKLNDNPSFNKEQQLKADAYAIKDQIKYYKKADKIKYINENGGSEIDISDSYSSKEIDRMFKQVQKGKKMKKVGYEWVVDYDS
ncbi:hypothetical protein IKQ21_09025 [bacterium]|nr:hypothetical protein [bacterium]